MFVKSKEQIIREQLNLKPQKQSKSLRQTLFAGRNNLRTCTCRNLVIDVPFFTLKCIDQDPVAVISNSSSA
jgi:hypothetical protein